MEEKRLSEARWGRNEYGGCYHQGSEDEEGRMKAGGRGFLMYIFKDAISPQV